MTSKNITLRILFQSVLGGITVSVVVLILDMLFSRFLSEQTNFLLSGDGRFISKIVLFFLAMSFFLLLRLLLYMEKMWARMEGQADNDCLQLFNSVEFCIVTYSVINNGEQFILKDLNSFAEDAEKLKKNDVLGKDFKKIFPSSEMFALCEVMQRVFRREVPELYAFSKNVDNKTYVWRKNYIIKTKKGDIACIYQNLVEQLETTSLLRRSQNEIDHIMSVLPVFFLIVNRKGLIVEAMGKAFSTIGLNAASLKGIHFREAFASNSKFVEHLVSAMNGLDFSAIINFNEKTFDLKFHPFSYSDGGGEITAIGHDISDRAIIEKEKERLMAAINQTDEEVVITNPDAVIEYVNPAFEKISGFSVDEVIGRHTRFLKSDIHDNTFYSELWKTITSGNVWRGHFFNKKKDASIYEEEAVISPVKDKWGKIINYVAVKRDVTNEVNLQKQLIQAQKMESIGRLAGGIAHDFNNILTAILGYSDLALSQIKSDNDLKESVEQIKLAGKRASSLTKQLLAFTRKQILNMQDFSTKEMISEIEQMLRRIIGEDVTINFHLPVDDIIICADHGQIEQVVMNLVLNAKDALPETGGCINFLVSKYHQKFSYDYAGFSATSGDYMKMSIVDNGHGMTQDIKMHLFEPFFTTKDKGKGTGLGLSTVYGIVKQHSGFISFESEVQKGTTFDVFIPIAHDKNTTVEAKAKGNHELSEKILERGAILVAEDDKVIQMLVNLELSREGFRVLVAGDGLEGKQILRQKGNNIKFALIDLVMPFMDGGKLAEYILKKRPDISIILMSGYPDVSLSEEIEAKKLPMLLKPFSQADLKAIVKKYFKI